MLSTEELIALDLKTVWHPYSQHGLSLNPIPVRAAQGAWIEFADGRKVLDAVSSWWVNIHGHSHPEIRDAIAQQASTLDHVLFAGFTHEPAVLLADGLIRRAHKSGHSGLTRVFFSDNGSTAVEVAMKAAFQYHCNLAATGDSRRTRFIALRGSYHGDTIGAMSVSEPEGFHRLFKPLLSQVDFVEPGNILELRELLKRHNGEPIHAALIVEPLIQGAAGMRTYSAEYLKEAVELCRADGILTIADEVFTGFYRTGTFFAFEQASIRPDLVALSKGLSGGVLPLGATLATEEVFRAFYSNDMRKALLHGHSYTGNPIACAAGLASLCLLGRPDVQEQVRKISAWTQASVAELAAHPRVSRACSLGTIGAITVRGDGCYFTKSPDETVQRAIDKGVLLRPLGRVLYAVPPYCVTEQELRRIYQVIGELIYEGF